jgi:hypothetical protein
MHPANSLEVCITYQMTTFTYRHKECGLFASGFNNLMQSYCYLELYFKTNSWCTFTSVGAHGRIVGLGTVLRGGRS